MLFKNIFFVTIFQIKPQFFNLKEDILFKILFYYFCFACFVLVLFSFVLFCFFWLFLGFFFWLFVFFFFFFWLFVFFFWGGGSIFQNIRGGINSKEDFSSEIEDLLERDEDMVVRVGGGVIKGDNHLLFESRNELPPFVSVSSFLCIRDEMTVRCRSIHL